MELIIGAVFGIAVALLCIWAYRKGLRDGQAIKKDKPIEKTTIPSPKLPKKKDKEKNMAEQQNEWMSYQPQYTGGRDA